MEEVFRNVFRVNGRIATKNLVRGKKVYDEDLVVVKGTEYRMWNPYRSKLAAAILKGLKTMKIEPGSKVLYLGAATGTTSSHVSDIVEEAGMVYCVEISERNMRDLLQVCEQRKNMLPIFEDARNVDVYAEDVGAPECHIPGRLGKGPGGHSAQEQRADEEGQLRLCSDKVAEHRHGRGPGKSLQGIPEPGLCSVRCHRDG